MAKYKVNILTKLTSTYLNKGKENGFVSLFIVINKTLWRSKVLDYTLWVNGSVE